MTASHIDPTPNYACGNDPRVGDLVEFGTRHTRLLVTEIDEQSVNWTMFCGSHQFRSTSLSLMILKARHGQEVSE